MAAKRHFRKVAIKIEYNNEHRLTWSQKLFYKPARTYICDSRTTRAKAEVVHVLVHKQFGLEFEPVVCEYYLERIEK